MRLWSFQNLACETPVFLRPSISSWADKKKGQSLSW